MLDLVRIEKYEKISLLFSFSILVMGPIYSTHKRESKFPQGHLFGWLVAKLSVIGLIFRIF